MAIDSSGYVPKQENTAWQLKKSGQHQGSNKVAAQHAERQVFSALPEASVYLIVQNAFPYAVCHELE